MQEHKTLEEQYRHTFETLIPDADWASVKTLEQPSPLNHIDSVTMPGTYIDPALHAFDGKMNAELE